MRPETIGLLAHLFRLARGMVNAIETYENKTYDLKLTPYQLNRERAAVAGFIRMALASVETLLIDAGAELGESVGSDHPPGVPSAGAANASAPPGSRRPGSQS
jgi:hypothetical protein